MTRIDPPTKVSWVRIPGRDLYSFFVGFSGFYFFPIFKNCLWQFVELYFSKSLLFLRLVSNVLQHTCPAPCRPTIEGVYYTTAIKKTSIFCGLREGLTHHYFKSILSSFYGKTFLFSIPSWGVGERSELRGGVGRSLGFWHSVQNFVSRIQNYLIE